MSAKSINIALPSQPWLAVLTVTPQGEFIWHADADQMIEQGNYTGAEAMPHILRRLRQRDELLEELQELMPTLEDQRIAARARAAIAKATETTP